MSGSQPPLTYRDAGVDIDAGDALVERIKPFAARTMRPEVLGGIGGFGALVEVSKKYRKISLPFLNFCIFRLKTAPIKFLTSPWPRFCLMS